MKLSNSDIDWLVLGNALILAMAAFRFRTLALVSALLFAYLIWRKYRRDGDEKRNGTKPRRRKQSR